MLALFASSALVLATSLLLSARVAEQSLVQWLLAAYVIGFSEIVLVTLALSVASALNRITLFASVAALFCVALPTAMGVDPPSLKPAARLLAVELRMPLLMVMATVVIGVVAYSVALALFTPQNETDALEYHLARAAFWRQQHAVNYISGAADVRLNANPPNGEIVMAFTMVISGVGRYAPLVQLLAAAVAGVAIYGIARRIGLSKHEGLLGSLLFLTLPVVALQMSTAMNDIVVASFVVISAFFFLGTSRVSLVLGGLSVALMIGSKLTGVLALPALAFIALNGHRRAWPRAVAMILISSGIGGYWYFVNLHDTGHLVGNMAAERANGDVVAIIARIIRLSLDVVELPGAVGLDRLLYIAAAVVVATISFATPGPARVRVIRAVLGGGATLVPIVLVPIDHLLVHASEKAFFELGRTDVGYLDSNRSVTKASPIFSWYGPVGVLLMLFSCIFFFRAVRRRETKVLPLFLAAAPVLWIALVGIAVPYFEWNGRLAMGGFALAAATWGVVLRAKPLASAMVALTALTCLLAFVHLHDRPSGIRLIEPTTERSVWSQPDWAVQATDHPHLRALLHFTEKNIPRHVRLGLQPSVWPGGTNPGGHLPPFPFFGSHLDRTVVFADSVRSAEEQDADWAILRNYRREECVAGWRRAFHYGVWIVLRRASGSRCA